MRAALWSVISLSVISLVIVGVLGFLALLLAFNGVSEARATPLLVAYFVLLLATLGATFWLSPRIFRRFSPTASRWISIPLTVLSMIVIGIAVLAVGFFVLTLMGTA
jgi:uncharacterized membrane-anchored protein